MRKLSDRRRRRPAAATVASKCSRASRRPGGAAVRCSALVGLPHPASPLGDRRRELRRMYPEAQAARIAQRGTHHSPKKPSINGTLASIPATNPSTCQGGRGRTARPKVAEEYTNTRRPTVPSTHQRRNKPAIRLPASRLAKGNTMRKLRKPWAKTIGTQASNNKARGTRVIGVCSDAFIGNSLNAHPLLPSPSSLTPPLPTKTRQPSRQHPE